MYARLTVNSKCENGGSISINMAPASLRRVSIRLSAFVSSLQLPIKLGENSDFCVTQDLIIPPSSLSAIIRPAASKLPSKSIITIDRLIPEEDQNSWPVFPGNNIVNY